MRIKSIIAPACHNLAFSSGFSTRQAKSRRCGRILMLHGVGDDEYSAADFQNQLHYLAQNFSIVKLDAIIEHLGNNAYGNEIALTFDDGLRNNLTSAYPILRHLNVPATFFVCPGLIESGRWLWTHEARARLRFLNSAILQKLLAAWNRPLDDSEEKIMNWMKGLPLKTRSKVENDLREETSAFCSTPEHQRKYDLMNWDELRSLDSTLVTIGSHTVTHPILSSLETDELSFEISTSRHLLESKLERPVEYFCYPNGSFNRAVIEEARKSYSAAVCIEAGLVTRSSDLYCLPRIGVAKNISLLAWRLHRPTA